MTAGLLALRDVSVHFPGRRTLADRLRGRPGAVARAVDGVSLDVERGELVALVGESGSGKTTTALAALRLCELTRGTVRLDGQDVTHAHGREMRSLRQTAQMVFQDPYGSLDPLMRVGDIVADGIRIHGLARDRDDEAAQVRDALERVGLRPADAFAERHPHRLSGGQRQRVAIAGSLALRPALLVADEPVSMLDVSVRAGILELLDGLRHSEDLGVLMVTHDLATAERVADRMVVMYHGRVVETGHARELIARPQHPYTEALVAAVPRLRRSTPRERLPRGEAPDPTRVPAGCRFHPRCPIAVDACRVTEPRLAPPAAGHASGRVACHLRSAAPVDRTPAES